MKDFVDALDEINQLSERAPGFVWRLQTEAGHSIDVRPFPDDDPDETSFALGEQGRVDIGRDVAARRFSRDRRRALR